MKALSLRQPWAWLVVNGHKDIENRTWALPKNFTVPQRVYIHAGKSFDDTIRGLDAEWIMGRLSTSAVEAMAIARFHRGAIIGEVTILGCVDGLEEAHSRWYAGPYGFLLNDAKAYEAPIPYKGMLGLFNVSSQDMMLALGFGARPSGSPPATR